MATPPRRILRGQTLFVTGRAVHRQHRFVPTPEVTHTIRYCLAAVSSEYAVQLHAFVWMSNHYHIVLTDEEAELPDFMRDLNSLIARALNALRAEKGENFERRGYNMVVVGDELRVLEHCAYTEANPCAADLVRYATQWEGVTSAAMKYGEVVEVSRPDFGLWGQPDALEFDDMDPRRAEFSGKTKCPKVAKLKLVAPPGSADYGRGSVRSKVNALEHRAKKARDAKDRKVMGMKRVRKAHYTDVPSTKEGFFGTTPTISAVDPARLRALAREMKIFYWEYCHALGEFRDGRRDTVFPAGTWRMRRFFKVPCAEQCPSGDLCPS